MTTSKEPSKNTKTALIDSAEKLFLTHGFDGVSIRQITDATGANVAAINYHFNGKTNLYREVLSRSLLEIAARKVTLLQELSGRQPAPELEEVLSAYIRSYFETMLSSPDSDRLLQTIYREMGPDAVASDLVTDLLVVPIHQAFQKTLLKICPELGPKHVSLSVSSITGQVLHFIRAREVLRSIRSPEQNETFVEDAIRHITEFSLSGIRSNPHV